MRYLTLMLLTFQFGKPNSVFHFRFKMHFLSGNTFNIIINIIEHIIILFNNIIILLDNIIIQDF